MLNRLEIFLNVFFPPKFLYNMEDLSMPYQALGKEEIPP